MDKKALKTMTYKLHCLINDMPSDVYHSTAGTYSSSQLKVAYTDEEKFHREYILNEKEKLESSSLDIGTYFHTAVLEPHLLKDEIVVFSGVRRGKAWEEFKDANKTRVIVTETEKLVAEGLVSAVRNSTIAMGRIERGTPEVSTFAEFAVIGSDIYSETYGAVLGKHGWKPCQRIPKGGVKITLKARADLLADDFILDLKSTTGNAKNPHEMRQKVSYYHYDLSAALYLDLFSLTSGRVKDEFIWTFASKDNFTSKSYSASPKNIEVGRVKWKTAVLNIADGIKNNWVFTDSMGWLEPNGYELDILKTKDEDLI